MWGIQVWQSEKDNDRQTRKLEQTIAGYSCTSTSMENGNALRTSEERRRTKLLVRTWPMGTRRKAIKRKEKKKSLDQPCQPDLPIWVLGIVADGANCLLMSFFFSSGIRNNVYRGKEAAERRRGGGEFEKCGNDNQSGQTDSREREPSWLRVILFISLDSHLPSRNKKLDRPKPCPLGDFMAS